MMRLSLLALLLAAASPDVSAQEALQYDALPSRPTANQRTTMVAVGLGVSLGSLALGDLDEAAWLVLGAPITSSLAVYLVGGMQGHDASLLATVGGGVAGAATGVGVMLLNKGALGYQPSGLETAGFFLGIGMYAVLPPIGAMVGYTATARPTVLTMPDGETVPAIALRIGL